MHLGLLDGFRRETPEFLFEWPQRFPRPGGFGIEPHAPVAVLSPRAGTQIQRRVGARIVEMRRGSQRTHAPLQIDLPVKLLHEINAFEPPVTEQLGVERSSDQLGTLALHSVANAAE